MTEAAQPLDPLTLPLAGSRLIEASAGTGKTWTIAALVLRLVLGHGTPPRGVDQILVMTFTRAATRELGERIRVRLVQAAAVFRGEAGTGDDAFLAALLAAHPEGEARSAAAWRLAQAAEAMDDAAVHTIDAWCQRMLREHAFDSGSLFDEELQADEAALRDAAVRDVWRQQVYPLQGEALAAVLAAWPSPAQLAAAIKALWEGELPGGAGRGSLGDAVARGRDERRAALAQLKRGWGERADQMRDWFDPIWRDKKHAARKCVPGQAHGNRWLDALKAWARDADQDALDLKTGRDRLQATRLAQDLGAAGLDGAVPQAFHDFEALLAGLDALPDPTTALRVHLAAQARQRLAQLKAGAGSFGFADLLQRLDDALDDTRHGDRARRLRQRILSQYPVALIDEFQDTSPVQLSVFERLYRIEDDDPATTLLLIGDPKQAIYAFRGADIQSYLRARAATAGRHHVLGTNHRSTAALVDAVNALFQRAQARDAQGAFGFGGALPFDPVRARGRPEVLCTADGPLPAVTWVADAVPRLAGDHQPLFAALAAEHIVTLLNDAEAGFRRADDGSFRRLRPADIAVLVRTGREAQVVRRALRQRGLASVYLSDRDSVFATPEAADLLRLLQAVATPRDGRLARAALATSLLARSLSELQALADDEAAFDRAAEVLQGLAPVWRSQGVLAMLRRALHAFDLPARWLAADDAAGERRLTNVLHLAELLQAAAGALDGEPALVRWLAQQVEGGDGGGGPDDPRVLRLESDADLVQVVTIHKSKGLEYPVVLLPFVAQCRPADPRDGLLWQPQPGGGRRLLTDPDAADWAQADEERLREDLRLLYVALTRARHALWVGLAAAWSGKPRAALWPRSAVGRLLCGPGVDDFRPALQALAGAAVQVQWLPETEAPPMPPVTRLCAPRDRPPLATAAPYTARFERDWAIASYSALVRDASRVGAEPPAARLLRADEPSDEDDAAPRGALQPWHRFPRGAFAGNFLHDQLEWLAGEGFALADDEALGQALQRRCERQGWGHRADDVIAWLQPVCATPLPPLGVPLSGLTSVWPEMEFWLPGDGLDAGRIDALCRRHLWPGAPRPALPPRTLKGLLMGFADLVFEHDGRWWVLDHKSNALGARDADYHAAALQAAMCEHRYDVQAALYLLALHRLLRARLGAAYVPAQHLGGAVYLFLRGIQGPEAGCCTVAAPVALVQALDALIVAEVPAP